MTKSSVPSHPLHQIIHLVAPFLPKYDLLALLRVDREIHRIILPWVYTRLSFQALRVSPHTALCRFVSLVNETHPGGYLVRDLVLTGLEERLYEEVPPSWLGRLLERCPNTEGIITVGCSLFNDRAVGYMLSSSHKSSLAWTRIRRFHHNGTALSTRMLMEALRNMPFLDELSLDGIQAGCLLPILRQSCHPLCRLTLTNASLSIERLSLGQSQCSSSNPFTLTYLDLSLNGKLTTQAFSSMTSDMVKSLHTLLLRGCTSLQTHDLITLAPHLTSLRVLDVSGCPSLSFPALHVISARAKLTRLIVSIRILCASSEALSPRPSGLTLLHTIFPALFSLEIHGLLPESEGAYWKASLVACSSLRLIIFHREASQYDDLLGSYSTPSPLPPPPPSYTTLEREEWGKYSQTPLPLLSSALPKNGLKTWSNLFPWVNASNQRIQVTFHTSASSSSYSSSMSSW
ncbi:MAG: hypothetical protein DHS80DRAFT_24687 [Piptocephalis tieghemiana]|nr:MAG: hypothetical protein DHS80DRAFT_24687 [Piptocephalis tieghemiana]